MNLRFAGGWLEQICLRRPPFAFRHFVSSAQCAILLISLLCSAAAFGAAPARPEDAPPDLRYWEKVRAQEAEQQKNEEQRQEEARDRVKAVLPDLDQAGAAFQREILIAQDGPPPPPLKPSIFEGKGDYIRGSLVFLLVVVLATQALVRHKREAEIRALRGGYLSDGTEVASFEMPAWFAPAPTEPQFDSGIGAFAEASNSDTPVLNRFAQFFEEAPEDLAGIHSVLGELGRITDPEERRTALSKLHELVSAFQSKANRWDFRPAWQMSSALELLVKRVADKPKDATPSTLRTIAAATDLLRELCVPGIRSNLIIDPPIRILAVDDDPFCMRAIVYGLQKATITPDLAENGAKAVALATETTYDVIFMDIQMPEMDGLTACAKIREIEANATTPVVFVTAQSDFQTRAKSTVMGGTDLMAKPFLVFELTVKALMFTMRKRLQLQQTEAKPMLAAGSLHDAVVAGADSSAPAADHAVSPSLPETCLVPPPAVALAASAPSEGGSAGQADLFQDFFTDAPAYLAATRKILAGVNSVPDQAERAQRIGHLYLRFHTVATKAAQGQLAVTERVASAVEALLQRLHKNPKTVTPSTLNTVSNALNLLERLCVPGVEEKFAGDSPVRLLVVDDEPLAKRAVVGALQLAFGKPDSANDGAKALVLAAEKPYDVIFTDVEMPVMDGFELCRQVRETGPNRNTPVVFITSHTNMASRADAVESGGNDFIAKPFLPIEITVKALTFALEGRLRKINAGPVLDAASIAARPLEVTRRNSPRELLAANG